MDLPQLQSEKSDRLTATDPETENAVPLFNPRKDRWEDHFAWLGFTAVGRTPTGRALVAAFGLNHPRRLQIRKAEEYFDLFPP